MVVGPGGGRATRPRAPAVRDGPSRPATPGARCRPGDAARPLQLYPLYRRQTPTNGNAARWLLVLIYYCEYAVSCRYSIPRSRFSNRSNR